ncbi:hypothetical protein BZL30_7094 [Mycobacterium kansasii]|uniref:Uncharacterized protein n=1 Tax=Mycobacterium kansasii TaxID=1768 RepID=A0A1V3WNQ7_MYCKA|nr:hypothetical protein BZL30_7094 [Mycobacterium kansasii]
MAPAAMPRPFTGAAGGVSAAGVVLGSSAGAVASAPGAGLPS